MWKSLSISMDRVKRIVVGPILFHPSIEYNTGDDMGPEVYFRPEVDNSVGSIRMHGHRIIFVDILHRLHSSCQMPLVIR